MTVLQSIIERSYGMPRIIDDAGLFLIGDSGYRILYPGFEAFEESSSARARLLVRHGPAALRVALYYPDALVHHLERHDPRSGLGDENIDAFAVFVEELDHLLVLASRAAAGRPVSMLELEFHAAVTKYLLIVHFLGRLTGRRRVSEFHRIWVRHHVFEKYADADGEEGRRYHEAARLAGRYVRLLDRLAPPERRTELQAFHERPFGDQVRRIEAA